MTLPSGDDIAWPERVNDALRDQRRLSSRLRTQSLDLSAVRNILAVGVGFSERRQVAVAAGVLCDLGGAPVGRSEVFLAERECHFPYKPGLFAYREGPGVMALLESLPGRLDLLVFCSQGTAHPRGFGLAAHLGVLVGSPSLGLTRKPLTGSALTPEQTDGAVADLRGRDGTLIGFSFRPLAECDPFFASPGHLTDLDTLRAYLRGLRSFKGCFPEALSVAQAAANKRAFERSR